MCTYRAFEAMVKGNSQKGLSRIVACVHLCFKKITVVLGDCHVVGVCSQSREHYKEAFMIVQKKTSWLHSVGSRGHYR